MKKIRIGNDFVFNWAIERGGLPENLESVLDAKLTASVFGKKQDIPFTVSGNIITIEFTPEICNIIGLYNLLFTYILPDLTLSDEERKCAVDVDAFQIVAKTAQADDSTEFSVTSDMAIAFKGDKGDKGDSAYQVWLEEGNIGTEEDYFAYLRQPAIDAGASISALEGEIQANEGLRVSAETARVNAEGDATKGRVKAENERVTAEGERAQAFEQMMGEADGKIEEMNTTLSTYDGRVTQVESDISQLADEVNLKEVKANKQNSLEVDGTGTKFPTVDAVNAKIGAMSGELIVDYTHTSNKEVHISSIDYATNTFTSVGHGLSNSTNYLETLMLAINRNELIYPYNVMPFANLTGYLPHQGFWVINATPDTFQLSFTNGGSPIVLLDKAETDLTKWHFEYNAATMVEITGLLGKINRGCRAVIDGSFCRFGASYIGCAINVGKLYYRGNSAAVQEALYANWNNSEIPVPSFGGVVVHTDYYTPSGHRKLLDVAIYSYTPTLNRIAFLQKVQNNISPVAIPDARKTKFSIEAGAMITNGTNIKLYTI